jgi:CRP/FNR family transcriptional regulator
VTNGSFIALRQVLAAGHEHLVDAFDSMSEDRQEALARCTRIRRVAAGEVVVREGSEDGELGYVIDGALGMIRGLPDGREHIVGILVPTDMFGRLFDGPSPHRIEALSQSRLLEFDRHPFEAILRDTPELERQFLVSVLDELDAAREWVLLLNGTGVVERVASFLLILARRQMRPGHAAAGSFTLQMPMRRADLARCLGVRPESLSRAIHRLAADGIIDIPGADCLAIRDPGGLVAASGQDLVLPEPMQRRTGSEG